MKKNVRTVQNVKILEIYPVAFLMTETSGVQPKTKTKSNSIQTDFGFDWFG